MLCTIRSKVDPSKEKSKTLHSRSNFLILLCFQPDHKSDQFLEEADFLMLEDSIASRAHSIILGGLSVTSAGTS